MKQITPADTGSSRTQRDRYLTPEQVVEMAPGLSKGQLAQLRFLGKGPRFRKPTPKTVLYRESEVIEWIEASVRTGTATDALGA
jgi:predicted DNA-binding transcriptional regulator AlpA